MNQAKFSILFYFNIFLVLVVFVLGGLIWYRWQGSESLLPEIFQQSTGPQAYFELSANKTVNVKKDDLVQFTIKLGATQTQPFNLVVAGIEWNSADFGYVSGLDVRGPLSVDPGVLSDTTNPAAWRRIYTFIADEMNGMFQLNANQSINLISFTLKANRDLNNAAVRFYSPDGTLPTVKFCQETTGTACTFLSTGLSSITEGRGVVTFTQSMVTPTPPSTDASCQTTFVLAATPTPTPSTAPISSLGDYVWIDADKDGIQDTGETPVPNVTVRLLNENNNVIRTTTTNAQGKYLFDNLTAGTYNVEFVLPVGYSFTLSNQGTNNNVDSDANVTNGRTGQITLPWGVDDMSWDAGIYLTPTATPTPSASPTPTPSPTPAVFACVDLTPQTSIERGKTISFICNASGNAGQSANFRILKDGQAFTDPNDPSTKNKLLTNNQAQWQYTIPGNAPAGNYVVQCQICNAANSCTAWLSTN